ncbi:MAG TPA: histidine kinase [Rhodanobacter sp.]|nr:histidine kinase [Rhodanobacter sp.]
MTAVDLSPKPKGFARVLGWRRVRYPFGAAALLGLLLMPGWEDHYWVLFSRVFFIALSGILAFGLFEQWPARLPRRMARWVLQVVAVAMVIPLAAWVAYFATTQSDPVPFWHNSDRLTGFGFMTVMGLLVAPWMAVSALIGQINGAAQRQALAFELERSELERKALDARMRLLQAQVEPHFLFNTLANVRELVDSGSPQASVVLGSLIAYLRAAVPRLHNPATTLGQELELVRAYLEVMHMRIPDRLTYVLHVDDTALALSCPPMALLTLVENAVRHGIDPSEEGGRIEVRVALRAGRCLAQVIDTGVGLQSAGGSLGTGLATLRERLQLVFGHDAQLRLSELAPHGACAELDFPARKDLA